MRKPPDPVAQHNIGAVSRSPRQGGVIVRERESDPVFSAGAAYRPHAPPCVQSSRDVADLIGEFARARERCLQSVPPARRIPNRETKHDPQTNFFFGIWLRTPDVT